MMNCCPTMPVAPRMPTSTLRETTIDSFLMMAGLKPCATAEKTKKKTRRLLSVGGLLNLVRVTGYASSAHTPPTRLVPFVGTRFRPVGLVVRTNIVKAVYGRDSQFVNDVRIFPHTAQWPSSVWAHSLSWFDLYGHAVI